MKGIPKWETKGRTSMVGGGPRRCSKRLVLCLSLSAIAAGQSTPVHAAPPDPGVTSGRHRVEVPADRPEIGLVYEGLKWVTSGRCEGLFRVTGTNLCTHGPDEAPPGFDVRKSVPPISQPRPKPLTATVPCGGDGSAGKRIQVIYARSSDRPDRYAAYLASIQQWAADADAVFLNSAAETGGIRHIRFVHDANCNIIVANAVMGTTGDDTFSDTVTALESLGYNRIDRKYMVFVDADVYCGIGTIAYDDQPGSANANNSAPSYGRTDAGCWGDTVSHEAHELMHNIGGVQLSAPHSSGGGHCVDEWDRMCYSDHPNYPPMQTLCTDPSHDTLFDCNHDDYYNTNPSAGSYLTTHWNAANSQYLMGSTSGPGNDNFAAAQVLAGLPGTATGTNANATQETGEPANTSDSAPIQSVWYSWSAPSSGNATVDLCGSDFDTTLGVYTGGAVGSLSQLVGNDDDPTSACGVGSRVSFAATGGVTYRFSVDGYGDAQGSITLHYNLVAAGPGNDNFAAAQVLAGLSGTATGTNVEATGEPSEPNNAGVSRPINSVWFYWRAPRSGWAKFHLCGSDFDTTLSVYRNRPLPALRQVASNDDDPSGRCGRASRVVFWAVGGRQYHVSVDGFEGEVGSIRLVWRLS